MTRVIVVGAGIAGVGCARALHSCGHDVVVLDRGQNLGGRMAVRETDGHVVDIGASYLTVSDPGFAAVTDEWCRAGVLHGWTDTFHVSSGHGLERTTTGPMRYAGTAGMRALVSLLAAPLPDVRRGVDVTAVAHVDGSWQVTATGTEQLIADAVVLAMPDPQAARLLHPGLAEALLPPDSDPWQPVVAVAARWDRRWWPETDGVFVDSSDVVSWLADDGRRRGDGAPVLVAHTTAEAAQGWLHDPDAALEPVLAAAAAALGVDGRPPAPLWTHVQRWGLARPSRPRPAPAFLLHSSGLGICGDGWGERARVEGAWLSGTRLAAELAGAGSTPALH